MDLINLSMGGTPANKPSFVPSPLQSAVFQAVETTDDNLIIEAVAGSGKTVTIVKASNYLPSSDDTLMLAFNKAIVTELQRRLPHGIDAKTFHALGMQAIRRACGSLKVNGQKVMELIDEIYGRGTFAKHWSDKVALSRLIGFAKCNGHMYDPIPHVEDFAELIKYHDLDFEIDHRPLLPKLVEVYRTSLEWKDEIDFDDMLLHPVVHDYPFREFDNVICDEAQDLSSLQHEILRRSVVKGGRVIAVGDTHQAIYGFRGADSGSMGNLKEVFDMRSLDLNVSYRCSKAIAELARDYVPHFECLPDAPAGSIETTYDLPAPGKLDTDTMVLCRLNAPLFRYGIQFLRKGHAIQLWTNLEAHLKSRIKAFQAKSTQAWKAQMLSWAQAEIEEAETKNKWARVMTVRDIRDTLSALAEGTTNPRQIEKNLTALTQSRRGPILSTIHKAKGSEAEKVVIMNFNDMPSEYAKLDWMKRQEDNITYVAITRAKTDLILHYRED